MSRLFSFAKRSCFALLLIASFGGLLAWGSTRPGTPLVVVPAATGALADEQLLGAASQPIPSNALRLRILANSNTPADTAEKLRVRDAILATVGPLLAHCTTADQAAQRLQTAIPQLSSVANAQLRADGVSYQATVRFGEIPFPTKRYGDRLYPAGLYRGLLITLGQAQGANWWCVLFPPLCYVATDTSEAHPADASTAYAASARFDAQQQEIGQSSATPQMRFALWDGLRALGRLLHLPF